MDCGGDGRTPSWQDEGRKKRKKDCAGRQAERRVRHDFACLLYLLSRPGRQKRGAGFFWARAFSFRALKFREEGAEEGCREEEIFAARAVYK